MSDEPAEIRRQRGWAVAELARDDLDLFGVEELVERIAALEAEIERARAQIARKTATRSAADALFSKRD
jgi:uncharacterized small protein (DUF1192 family)